MDSYNYTLSDGRQVELINHGGTSWGYEVRVIHGPKLGMIWYGVDEGTEDEELKPFEKELLAFLDEKTKIDL